MSVLNFRLQISDFRLNLPVNLQSQSEIKSEI